MFHSLSLTLFVLLACTGCAALGDPTLSTSAYRHNLTQASICQYIATLATSVAWSNQQKGVPVEDVIDAMDAHMATRTSLSPRDSRQINRAIYVVYANPQWTEDQARTGVEQDCRRTSMY